MENLPTELLYAIADHLAKNDLFHLILSSRRFHVILLEKLYTEVILYKNEDMSNDFRQVRSFFSAIFGRPKLATHVHSLAIGCSAGTGGEGLEGQAEVDGKLLSQIAPQLVSERTEYSEVEKSKWLKDLREEEESDPWIALLLPKLTELRKLSIFWPDVSRHVMNVLRKLSMAPEPNFPHLQEVWSASYDGVESAIPSYYVNAFFRMPSMRKFGCNDLGESVVDEDYLVIMAEELDPRALISRKQDVLPPRISNIVDLDLSHVNAGNGMQEWIHACKALKSFRLSHNNGVGPGGEFEPRKLYEALSMHKQTLESVWIEPDKSVETDMDYEWMGTFVDFIALETICLTFPSLVEVNEHRLPIRKLGDLLPCSLKTLYLMLDTGGPAFMEAITQLGDLATRDDFSKLTAIYIEYYAIRSTDEEEKLEWLKQRCEAAGKSFYVYFSKGWFLGARKPSAWIFGPDNEAQDMWRLFC
ncbi:hypothetical protein N7527_009030 [Penicillium freii]|nr:hypothetical protein N7527_009030 [Penicillium freii]